MSATLSTNKRALLTTLDMLEKRRKSLLESLWLTAVQYAEAQAVRHGLELPLRVLHVCACTDLCTQFLVLTWSLAPTLLAHLGARRGFPPFRLVS